MAKRGARTAQPGTGDYLKEAFLFRWNLLALAAGVGLAALSPFAAIALPVVGAAELLYLMGLVSVPRFRQVVDRKLHEKARSAGAARGARSSPDEALRELLGRLPWPHRQRFDALRQRCLEMRSIATGVGGRASGGSAVDAVATPGLDRLLWVFLRLLVSQESLQRFLDATDEPAIEKQVADLRRRVEELGEGGHERVRRSLTDALATAELRLSNYRKAHENARFVSLEIERLESKIQTLSEMAINRQDPDYISREVDSVTASISHTEAAMNELQLVTGLMEDLEEPPLILGTDLDERTPA